ncbi:hypothetical protein [Litoribacter populi]|uniref:hypothetical protein n=1 Tax=Litoribacter populi TaxID=2598460 RepID=UPI00117F8B73|nr:hypothetical protein [Litoribacter populi]
MKNLILLLATFLLVFPYAKSQSLGFQQNVDEIILLNVNAIEQASFNFQNLAYIQQIGNVNVARSVQENRGFNQNVTLVRQGGVANIGRVDQRGSAHELLLQQLGDINFINFIQRGNFSNFIIDQSGTGNVLDVYVFNNSGSRSSGNIRQEGNYNHIELLMYGGRAVDIFQKGERHSINAIVSGEDSSLKIFQESGMAGEGMRVYVFTGN